MEKLDDFSKIMIATGVINYMASAVNGVNESLKQIKNSPKLLDQGLMDTLGEGIQTRNYLLRDVREELYNIMNRLGDYMNDNDCISPIDMRVTEAAFDIVSGEKDNTGD